MSDYEFTLSLRIRHPRIDPSIITDELGIEPQHTWKAGDRRLDATGEAIEGSYRESYWMARLLEQPQLSSERHSVEGMLMQTLAQLQRSQPFLERINAEQGVAVGRGLLVGRVGRHVVEQVIPGVGYDRRVCLILLWYP